MNITLVSAIFDLHQETDDPRKTPENRIHRFEELAVTGLPIVLFSCPLYEKRLLPLLEKYPNVKLIEAMSFSELKIAELCKAHETLTGKEIMLPEIRNPQKDTKEFFILMNAKIEFVKKAIEKNVWNTEYFCWIDFSITYMMTDENRLQIQDKLRDLGKHVFMKKKFVYIGSACPKQDTNRTNNAEWRFIGGVFLGDKEGLLHFYDVSLQLFPSFLHLEHKLVWEMNYWAWLERISVFYPLTYPSDCNEYAILNLPLQLTEKELITRFLPHWIFHPQETIFPTSISYYIASHLLPANVYRTSISQEPPVYVSIDTPSNHEFYITYFFFYPPSLASHQETYVKLHIKKQKLHRIYYSGSHWVDEVSFDPVTGRPLVYVSLGTHVCYEKEGVHHGNHITEKGSFLVPRTFQLIESMLRGVEETVTFRM